MDYTGRAFVLLHYAIDAEQIVDSLPLTYREKFIQFDQATTSFTENLFPWIQTNSLGTKENLLIFQSKNDFLSLEYLKYALGERWCDLGEQERYKFQGLWDVSPASSQTFIFNIYFDTETTYNELKDYEKEKLDNFNHEEMSDDLKKIKDSCPWINESSLTLADKILLFYVNQIVDSSPW